MIRQVKGIWIPIEIWTDKDLSWNEKILLLEISSFTSKNLDCFFSDDYISDLLGLSRARANKTLSSLIQKGYVTKTRFDGRRRFVKTNISYGISAMTETAYQPCQFGHNNNIDNKVSIKRENKGSDQFVKPTLDEVLEYCRTRNNNVDPQMFFDFYESKGWMVGKNKMKDWKASVRTWERSRNDKTNTYQRPAKESVLEHNLKVMDQMFGTDLHQQAYGGHNNGQ